mmetsp:Transcript_86501/g.264690  ORF Transcript_86501/g.264690 Transcript_86501/m.264690 type:complete len:202 (-) Transcript_86501:264-869(-)
MLGWAALGLGFASRAQCAELAPCRPKMVKGRALKLSFCFSKINVPTLVGGGVISSMQRPFITVSVGEKTKQTELADWCQEEGCWRFGEVITMEVAPQDEVLISVNCNKQYDLVVAALALSAQFVGQVCVPVASVLPLLSMEDRDLDGMVYATQDIPFDLHKEGAKIGRVAIAFETRHPPGACAGRPSPCEGPWCDFSARAP